MEGMSLMQQLANKQGAALFPAVPLITCDPYFSLWSPGPILYENDSKHWAGETKKVLGTAVIDKKEYRFMGLGRQPAMEQTGSEISATASRYMFEKGGIRLYVQFRTPLLLEDLELVSRSCSYIDLSAESTDGKDHHVQIVFQFDQAFCYDGNIHPEMGGGELCGKAARYAWMGRKKQMPLNHSGDGITIDWGYLYLAAPKGAAASLSYEPEGMGLCASLELDVKTDGAAKTYFVAAYDDIASIFYFGKIMPGYWARNGKTIYTAIEEAILQHDELMDRCDRFDGELAKRASAFGPAYQTLCIAAYRQSIAAHKLIADEDGNVIFLSKENFSNGCIGTVDVTYPSTPLYFLYNPELVRGMMRPILKFARMPVWEYDFAPHDVGRYPYASGQVYSLNPHQPVAKTVGTGEKNGYVFPMYYQMPAGADVYLPDHQMPVEECGNMLTLAAALVRIDPEGEKGFAKENMDLYGKWVKYLLEYGADPGEQLCTDDFAGHLAHNINLALKAVMGIASYAILLETAGDQAGAEEYVRKSRDMAADILQRAASGNHTRLTFDGPDEGWSLKYNAVWDLLFDTKLMPEEFYSNEIAWYKKRQNRYGVPLDSRNTYTKSDWMMWCAAMAPEKKDVEMFASSILRFLEETGDHNPFPDWYGTVNAKQIGFQNRTVQGGIFMPLLQEQVLR